MKNSRVLKIILFISGLIATGIGGTILFMPVPFYAGNGIDLVGNVSLLNEIRASGGALMISGILILLGSFIEKLTFTSVIISSLLYLSYGLSRILSIVIDGIPAEGLHQAAIFEIIIGLLCVFAFVKYNVRNNIN